MALSYSLKYDSKSSITISGTESSILTHILLSAYDLLLLLSQEVSLSHLKKALNGFCLAYSNCEYCYSHTVWLLLGEIREFQHKYFKSWSDYWDDS